MAERHVVKGETTLTSKLSPRRKVGEKHEWQKSLTSYSPVVVGLWQVSSVYSLDSVNDFAKLKSVTEKGDCGCPGTSCSTTLLTPVKRKGLPV